MPFIDTAAAARIREEREARGLSPERLAQEIAELTRREGWKLGAVDAFTIRRIEGRPDRPGRVPGIRVQCVLGLYFGIPHTEIWKPANRISVASDRQAVTA